MILSELRAWGLSVLNRTGLGNFQVRDLFLVCTRQKFSHKEHGEAKFPYYM
jgi:hypothetical protein